MIARFLDVSMTTKTSHVYLWAHQMIRNNARKFQNPFWKILLLEISKCRDAILLNLSEKTEADTSWRSVLNILENLEYGINLSQKLWIGNLVISIEWTCWMRDQYLSEQRTNHSVLNMGPMSSRKHELGSLVIFNWRSFDNSKIFWCSIKGTLIF